MWEQWAPPSAIKSGVLFIGPGGGKSGTSWWSECFSVVEIDWKSAQHHDYNFGLNKPKWTATVTATNGIATTFNRQLSATRPLIAVAFPSLHMARQQNFIPWFANSDVRRKRENKKNPLWTLDDNDRAMRGRWLTIIAAKNSNGSQFHLYTLYKKRRRRLATMCSNAKWPRWRLFFFSLFFLKEH